MNESVILDEVARYANAELPERYQDEFHYLLARYHFVRGRALDKVEQKAEAAKSFEEAKRSPSPIPQSGPLLRAGQVPGGPHLVPRREVRPGAGGDEGGRPAHPARAPTGRAADAQGGGREPVSSPSCSWRAPTTAHGRTATPSTTYGKIERGKPQWLESLFESSWANYRIGQYEQALGNLITLSCPFFRDEYFPEALILKAVIYYENCRYRGVARRSSRTSSALPAGPRRSWTTLPGRTWRRPSTTTVLADIQKKNADGEEGQPDRT